MIANEKQAMDLKELSFGPFSLCNNLLQQFIIYCCVLLKHYHLHEPYCKLILGIPNQFMVPVDVTSSAHNI